MKSGKKTRIIKNKQKIFNKRGSQVLSKYEKTNFVY